MSCMNCQQTACNNCANCQPTITPVCDPCASTPSVTPMAQCTTPAPCNAGCEETVPCGCTIYKGPVLTTIDLIDGETLCQALEKINSRIRLLSLGTAFPEFTYRVGCMTNVLSPVYLNFLRKNGTNVVTSQVTYANAAALLTYLQTQDSNFAFDTVTKAYIYSGPHLWDMEIVCTVNA